MTSIIKVDNLQNQCGANIINENAGTITIGASGDTIALAAGASQSGFGRSGSVNWDTTPKTANFTGVSGEGYFVDTTLGAITIDLPATPSAGDIVAIADYANTAATNNITVGRNSSPIDGEAIDAKIKINGQVYTLVYVDATEGWKTVGQTFNQITTAEFVAATGGTITTCGNYKIHTFTSPGTFTVSSAGNSSGSNSVDYMVVAGGGGGGSARGGGGGAGGFRESVPSPAAWTASPLANPNGALPVSVQGYPISVGGGGAGEPGPTNNGAGTQGTPSVFSTITSTGGGGGRDDDSPAPGNPGTNGGSGGGAGGGANPLNISGTGNTPPTSPPQGNNGGSAVGNGPGPIGNIGGGGGGATQAGFNHTSPGNEGKGGAGGTTSISSSSTTYAGGGGAGAAFSPLGSIGGPGGGGNGGAPGAAGSNGTTNTGGGAGGGACGANAGGSGGSGIVIIRYKFQ
jgi:hypothetical protein